MNLKQTVAPEAGRMSFVVDARTIVALGRNSIKDHVTAVVELVKNSYDAGAKVVEIWLSITSENAADNFIRISDDGCGMDEETLRACWFRIGFSEKLAKPTTKGRRKLGEKGVGRISADRLGSVLDLRSQAAGKVAVGLTMDWSNFEHEGTTVDEIDFPWYKEISFKIPQPSVYNKEKDAFLPSPEPCDNSAKCTGTELRVTQLRQGWTTEDMRSLHKELSLLVNPLVAADGDFQIRLHNDRASELNGVIRTVPAIAAEIEATFHLKKSGAVFWDLVTRDESGKQEKPEKATTPWRQFVHRNDKAEKEAGIVLDAKKSLKILGPVYVKLLFFPHKRETLRGTAINFERFKSYLQQHSGIKVYRDDVRVLPYGDSKKPEGDWLGLGDRKAREPAGPSRETWRVSPYQIIGFVSLSRDANPDLADTSGREGLVNSDALRLLKAFLLGCILRLEARYHRLFLDRKKSDDEEEDAPRETVTKLSAELSALGEQIKSFGQTLPKAKQKATEDLRRKIDTTGGRLATMQRTMEKLSEQTTNYRGLSTLGIAAATFGHETQLALEQVKTSLDASAGCLDHQPPHVTDALQEIANASQNADRVAAWGAFAMQRTSFDKRRQTALNTKKIVKTIVDELTPAFISSGIKLKSDLKAAEGHGYAMDLESVVVNLLTNAYYFTKKSKRARKVKISTRLVTRDSRKGLEIVVADSGPGVDPKIVDAIWEPLFTTKVDRDGKPEGTGLGLNIVDSVVGDWRGTRQVSTDATLKGARFSVWLPLQPE